MNDTQQPVESTEDQPVQVQVWGLKALIAAAIAAVALVGVTIGLAIGVAYLLRTNGAPADIGRPLSLGATAIYEAGFVLIAYVVARRHGLGWPALGFRRFSPVFIFGAIVLLCSGYLITGIYGLILQRLGIGEAFPQRTDLLVGKDLVSFIPALFVASVVAPVAEETFFRGLILTGLRSRFGLPAAMIASSLLFALVHLVAQVFVPIFVLGIFLSLLYVSSKSLWPSIVLHSAFNGVSLTLVYFYGQVSGRT